MSPLEIQRPIISRPFPVPRIQLHSNKVLTPVLLDLWSLLWRGQLTDFKSIHKSRVSEQGEVGFRV